MKRHTSVIRGRKTVSSRSFAISRDWEVVSTNIDLAKPDASGYGREIEIDDDLHSSVDDPVEHQRQRLDDSPVTALKVFQGHLISDGAYPTGVTHDFELSPKAPSSFFKPRLTITECESATNCYRQITYDWEDRKEYEH